MDQNCDGLELCYADADGDGYPSDQLQDARYSSSLTCTGLGISDDNGGLFDCNDSDPNAGEIGEEIIGDGIDSDCDGAEICYVDQDGDGYRTDDTVVSADSDCDDPEEALAALPSGDCDDGEPNANPAETELVGDGIDNDCDGLNLCYGDQDDDGYHTGPPAPTADPPPGDGPSSPPMVCNMMWMANDFTAENGATRVVPRSHLSGCQPDPARTDYGEIPIEAPAGSVLVWEGRTWHAAGLNVSDHPRYGVVTYFCAPIIRSLGNLTYGMRSETRDAMGPDLLKLAGFTPWNSYGMTDDPYADVARAGDDTAGRLG